MIIYFGLELEELAYPIPEKTIGGVHYFGPNDLLYMLESHLGLSGYSNTDEFLRIEQYRQLVKAYLEQYPHAFYATSFQADQFATATELLFRRDELLLAGWDFQKEENTPDRLTCLADLESWLKEAPDPEQTFSLLFGFADRFITVLKYLDERNPPIKNIYLNEPMEKLPSHLQTLFNKLKKQGVEIVALPEEAVAENTDLDKFRGKLLNATKSNQKQLLQKDGSLLILRGKRDTELASFLAKTFSKNPDFQPLCLIPNKSRTLDNAIIQEGLPSMGILTSSLARPSLQVLKLVTVFLWEPVDPYKILEFASLAVKPLEQKLSELIASQMAQNPGLQGDGWNAMIVRYFDELDERAKIDSSIQPLGIRKQYRFWFERKRYNQSHKVPKKEVIEIFDFLFNWARQAYEDSEERNNSLFVLGNQARRIKELLETLPEDQLSHLELERIVRTIYEPAPHQFKEIELGHLPYVYHSSAIIGPVEQMLWWNFTKNEKEHFFSRWYPKERKYLHQLKVELSTPESENAILLWQRKRPFLHCSKTMVLTIPESVDGNVVHPHPLFGDLEATFENVEEITCHLDRESDREKFASFFTLPSNKPIDLQPKRNPTPFIQIQSKQHLEQRDQESLTSLETLFYYPYQWIFRYKARFKNSSILSIVKELTLMGNLAHRFFEKLFRQEDLENWDQAQLNQWIDKEATPLLQKEGAVLLLYGREPEKIGFIKKIKFAAWSLLSLIRNNHWKVVETEKKLEGQFAGITINGRADLVLEKENQYAIVDLKWRGASRRERIIRNEEDLQLVLYANLLHKEASWPQTAYFILENGRMIARNNEAFQEVTAVLADADQETIQNRILARMHATYRWRLNQFSQGQIEVRCEQTQSELEELYADELLDLLEMKPGNAPFDDYRTLINLVD